MNDLEVISPVGGPLEQKTPLAPRLDTLEGKIIGESWNDDFKGDLMFPMYRKLLKERFPGVTIIPYTEFPIAPTGGTPAHQWEMARKTAQLAKERGCDALIAGNGGCGVCTPVALRPAVEAEKAGIPSVLITNTGFTSVAQIAAKGAGLEGIRLAVYPGPSGVHSEEEIALNITKTLIQQIIDGLVKSEAKTDSGKSSRWNPKAIAFRGSFDGVNKHFFDHEWTDGLPVVPPTLDRIEKFLEYSPCAAEELVGVLPQANLKAVAWNIAANGVMAGLAPEHMPLLIAMVKAIADPHYNLNNIGTTWGVLPYLLVNGPVVKDKRLQLECGGQLISRGSNPALGRALGLIIRNIGGYRPARNYMGTFGYPLVFALAENEDQNPWQPYHVERGFKKEASTVTVGATVTWGWPPSPYSGTEKTGGQASLEMLAVEVTKKPCLVRLAEQGPQSMNNIVTFLLAPPVAEALAKDGLSKDDIRNFVYENARVPLRELEFMNRFGQAEQNTVREKVEMGLYTKDFLVDSNEMVRVLPSPDRIHIVVCGDPHRNRVMTLWGGYARMTTKEVQLPSKWSN